VEHKDSKRRENEPARPDQRPEKEKEKPGRRPRWSRDVEVKRSVNAAVQDADFDR
jgi:hypothetical protein